MTLVLDASALLLGADARPESPGWLVRVNAISAHDLLAPALAAWEVGHVVHRKFPQKFGRDAAERCAVVEQLLEGVVLIPPTPRRLDRAGHLAEKHGLAFYDAAYLELAGSVPNATLVTEDVRLRRAGEAELGARRALATADAQGLAGMGPD